MLRPVPCKRCGVAKLHNKEADYVMGKIPLALKRPGGVWTTKCFCGNVIKLTRSEFMAIKDIDDAS